MQINSHLSVLVHDLAKKWGEKTALTFRKFGSDQWQSVSFNLFSLRVKQVSNALLNLGAKPLDKIAVFSQNCVHYLYTDFGAYGIRVTSVPFYANSSEQQIQYMINDAQIRFLFVGEQEQYDKAHRIFALCPSLERIIIFDSSVRISTHDPAALYFKDFLKLGENLPRQTEVEELYKQASMDDLVNILYTSGTTGDSKGVMLTYSQYYAALKANDECVPVTDKDRVIDFLPFTHIFERAWSYLCLSEGAELIIHNASFDVGFLNMELRRLGKGRIEDYCLKVTDSLKMASDMFPGLRNNLDVLCTRYEIDRSARTLHGALLDARLLAEVYLAMTRKQGELLGDTYEAGEKGFQIPDKSLFVRAEVPADELAEHEAFLERIAKKCKKGCRWTQALHSEEPTNAS